MFLQCWESPGPHTWQVKVQLLSYVLCVPHDPDGQISRANVDFVYKRGRKDIWLETTLLSGRQPKPLALYEHLLCALTKWGLLFTKMLPAPPSREAARPWGHPGHPLGLTGWCREDIRVVSGGQPRPSSEFLSSHISSPLQVASGDLGSEAPASCVSTQEQELSSVSSALSCHHKFSSS